MQPSACRYPGNYGELPSRLIRHRLAYAKPHARNSPDGPDSCEITRAITLVHLTTGTFNHFVKDPIALRLSGAFQVPQVYLERKPWSSSKLVVSPAPKSARDEPFKLTPSGCFLSMWISLEIRGESLLSRLDTSSWPLAFSPWPEPLDSTVQTAHKRSPSLLLLKAKS